MKKQDEGFTLIELLIVIVILGILATVTVFAVGGITDRGKKSSCKADYKTMEVALEAYQAQNGSYPAAGEDDDALLTGATGYLRTDNKSYNYGANGQVTLDSRNPNPCTETPTD